VAARAGSAGRRFLADRVGLTGAVSAALRRRSFVPRHDRGPVLTDVAVMLADGGHPNRGTPTGPGNARPRAPPAALSSPSGTISPQGGQHQLHPAPNPPREKSRLVGRTKN
jgi:hypothetical protein